MLSDMLSGGALQSRIIMMAGGTSDSTARPAHAANDVAPVR